MANIRIALLLAIVSVAVFGGSIIAQHYAVPA